RGDLILRRTSNKDGIRTFSTDTELVESRRAEIVDDATRVFVKKGYHETNMRELANEIGKSVGCIYHYVGSKQDILYLIIDKANNRGEHWIEGIESSLNTISARKALEHFIREYYTYTGIKQDATTFAYQEVPSLERKWRKEITDTARQDVEACSIILRKGVETGEFQIENVIMMAHNIIVLGHMWALRNWYLKKICSLDEYIKQQTAIILRSITNRG
ncbi:MAG: TetR/AcrR family transcriptional regulator, partial [Dehalococcoidia bacterium]